LNVWGVRADWQEWRRWLVRDGFAALAPDLVTLQETIVRDGYDQVGEILGDGFEVVHQKRREPDAGLRHLVTATHPFDDCDGRLRAQPSSAVASCGAPTGLDSGDPRCRR